MGADVDAVRAERRLRAAAIAQSIDFDDEDRELGPDEAMVMLRVVGPGAADAQLEDAVEGYLHQLGFLVVDQ